MKAKFLIILPLLLAFNAPSYDQEKSSIQANRSQFKQKYDAAKTLSEKEKISDEVASYLKRSITEKIIPHWYGTEWDFNGYTAKPGEGKIACGYFVSTVLKHSGFNLNRYKLAQQHALSEVKTIAVGNKIHSYYNVSRDEFLTKAKNQLISDLYIIGLDSHVGFLLVEKDEIYFIHSNYRDPVAVVKEKASTSQALNDSHTFLLTGITQNRKLVSKWMDGDEIQIVN